MANVTSTTSLVGPSGNTVGQPVIVNTETKIEPNGEFPDGGGADIIP